MAILPIVHAGAPVLKQIATPVERVDKNIRKLLDDMKETMEEKNGVGLAAPQVAVSKRIIICNDGNTYLELINPVILKKEGEVLDMEGCLSVPGYFGEVCRASKITVEAMNRNNKKVRFQAQGFLARIIQHEIDHLDGILFIEKADALTYEAPTTA